MSIVTLTSNESGANSLTDINANFVDLDTTKADLASPALTGNPTAPTQTAGDNSTKLATTAYVDASSTLTIETTSGVTHSLVTTAGQRVMVWAKGVVGGAAGANTLYLKYNNVTKDTSAYVVGSGMLGGFSLQYTETPGAGTHNITVEVSGGSIQNVVIMVLKLG